MLKNLNVLNTLKFFYKNIFYYNFKDLFFISKFLIFEYKDLRILPNSGDLVIAKYYYRYTGIKTSFYKYSLVFGICISRNSKNLNSLFILRNSYKRNAFEFGFFLYSPLLKSIKFFSNKRKYYNKASLFFLREKKIYLSRVYL